MSNFRNMYPVLAGKRFYLTSCATSVWCYEHLPPRTQQQTLVWQLPVPNPSSAGARVLVSHAWPGPGQSKQTATHSEAWLIPVQLLGHWGHCCVSPGVFLPSAAPSWKAALHVTPKGRDPRGKAETEIHCFSKTGKRILWSFFWISM